MIGCSASPVIQLCPLISYSIFLLLRTIRIHATRYIINSIVSNHQSSSFFEERSYFCNLVLVHSILHFFLWATEQKVPGVQRAYNTLCNTSAGLLRQLLFAWIMRSTQLVRHSFLGSVLCDSIKNL